MRSWFNQKIEKITSKNSFVLIFLFCATFFAYANILIGDFVFDDNIFIENNVQIRSLSNVEQIYTSSTTAGSGLVGDNFYRPNQQFIYAVLYSMFGLSPFFFHLVPILFHILNGFLIFLLFTRLGISRRSALFGSLLFLLHPVLTQAVSYISGLSEPLVGTTILGTVLIFMEAVKKIEINKFLKWLLAGMCVFTLGLFSKENQALALGIIFLIFIFQYKRGELNHIFYPLVFIASLAGIFFLYILARLNFLNFTGVIGFSGELNLYTQSIWVRLSTFIHILPEYFKMIFLPWHLYYEKPYLAYDSVFNVQSLLSIVIILSGLVSAGISFFKKNGEIFLGIAWFFVALLPVSGVIPLNSMYLEHWLYMPIIGIIFLLCFYLDTASEKLKKIIIYLLIIVLILFSFRIIARNAEWGNPVKFYTNEIKYTQTSARIYNNLAMELADRGNCVSAIPNYQRAIELADVYPQTHHNLARCLEAMGELEAAREEYLKALQIQPDFPYSINALQNLEQRMNKR